MRKILAALAVAVCTARGAVAAAITHFTVTPSDTPGGIGAPPGIGEFNDSDHHLYTPASPGPNPKLVIFFHGAGDVPAMYTDFLHVAADQGYYVIGLSYPNVGAMFQICDGMGLDCAGDVREEVWNGVDTSLLVTIDTHPQDCIRVRLRALFRWLMNPLNGHASDGWDHFWDGTSIDWSRVVLAGHSNGAGFAAYIAAQKSVDRVLLFAGGGDGKDDPMGPIQLANWVAPASSTATDALRYYALAHTNDISCNMQVPRIEKLRRTWSVLGLPGVARTIDYVIPATYAPARQLLTSRALWPLAMAPCDQQGMAHMGVVANGFSPDAFLVMAWRYMLGTP